MEIISSSGFCPRCGNRNVIMSAARGYRCDACVHEWTQAHIGGLPPRKAWAYTRQRARHRAVRAIALFLSGGHM